MRKATNVNKKRLIYVFCILATMTVVLCFRTGYIQVVKGAEYKSKATAQHTRDNTVTANRGTIYDRNGDAMAVSATSYAIWVRPANLPKGKVNAVAKKLAKILNMENADVTDVLTRKSVLIRLTSGIDKDTMEKVKAEKISGIEIVEGKSRYYPMDTLAAQVVGNVSSDGNGLAGLEMQYNSELNGVSGKSISTTDVAGRSLSYGSDKYYQEEDGLNLVTSIDSVVQNHVEKAIKKGLKTTKADKVMCLMMNPKTGEVLASATTDTYDPNDARTPLDSGEAAKLEKMPSSKQAEYLNKMWRNPLVSDTYEPGSTFKLLTLSATLEERKSNLKEHFYCSGTYNVSGTTLKCWSYQNPHGDETLKEAVGNSCNPVFIQLGKRLGTDTFYKYLDLFGITETTGLDYPGEAKAQIKDKSSLTTVDFATMSYGQGISVTPIQLLTAVNAIGNDGVVVKPRMVNKLTDSKGKTIKAYKTEVVRQAISKQTASEVREAMKYVVEESGGTAAKVAGYTIGGKTGTAQNESRGLASKTYYASFIGMAPIDNPKVSILVVVDNPKGKIHGSEAAAPIVKEIMGQVLPYLDAR